MATYEVELNGQNFWLEVDGVPRRLGFYTLRYVEAVSPETAVQLAIQALSNHESLANVLNERSDLPIVHAEDVIELDEEPIWDQLDLGLSFYAEDDDS